ncbi:MAG: polyphosphate polymerase domain-containing protein [Acidobacteria bacterium]|nr:polyphosphate polymerase domain-containing protein [Acidobacteriota bacterium]
MQPAALPRQHAPPEHELKFVVAAIRAEPLLEWLRARCVPDPIYPDGLVTSIYFDNRSMVLLRAKINSDFIKRKVRVRWYADPATGIAQDPAFVEIKERVGARRFKIRVPLEVTAAEIAGNASISALRGLLTPLRQAGHWVAADLQPFLRIAFRRRRFTDPTNGARISIDSSIRGTTANPALLATCRPALLTHAVIEVKGESRELSRWMVPLRHLGCRRESFSKYERCFRKLTGNSW